MTIILAMMLAAVAAGADAKLALAVKAGDKAAIQMLLQQRVDVMRLKWMAQRHCIGPCEMTTANS